MGEINLRKSLPLFYRVNIKTIDHSFNQNVLISDIETSIRVQCSIFNFSILNFWPAIHLTMKRLSLLSKISCIFSSFFNPLFFNPQLCFIILTPFLYFILGISSFLSYLTSLVFNNQAEKACAPTHPLLFSILPRMWLIPPSFCAATPTSFLFFLFFPVPLPSSQNTTGTTPCPEGSSWETWSHMLRKEEVGGEKQQLRWRNRWRRKWERSVLVLRGTETGKGVEKMKRSTTKQKYKEKVRN